MRVAFATMLLWMLRLDGWRRNAALVGVLAGLGWACGASQKAVRKGLSKPVGRESHARVVGPPMLVMQQGHASWIRSVVLNATGNRVFTSGADRTVRIWDADTGMLLAALEGHEGAVDTVALSPDGRLIASGSRDATLRIWDVDSGRLLSTLAAHLGAVTGVAFSRDGRLVASSGTDNTVRVWDPANKKTIAVLKEHASWVIKVAFGPGILASADLDDLVKLWDTKNWSLLATLHGIDSTDRLEFSADGRRLLATGSRWAAVERDGGGTIRTNLDSAKVWDVKSRSVLFSFDEPTSNKFELAFRPDGTLLSLRAEPSSGTVRVLDVDNGRTIALLRDQPYVDNAAIGSSRLTLGTRGGVGVWDVATGRRISILRGAESRAAAAFSGDGRHLAAGYGSDLVLWDLPNVRMTSTFTGDSPIVSIAFDSGRVPSPVEIG